MDNVPRGTLGGAEVVNRAGNFTEFEPWPSTPRVRMDSEMFFLEVDLFHVEHFLEPSTRTDELRDSESPRTHLGKSWTHRVDDPHHAFSLPFVMLEFVPRGTIVPVEVFHWNSGSEAPVFDRSFCRRRQ